MTKSKKPPPKLVVLDPEAMLMESYASLKRSMDALDNDPSAYAAKSRLSEALIKISGEMRQLQKQHRRDLDRYTVEELVDHILGLDDKQQKAIADAILRDGRAESSLFGES